MNLFSTAAELDEELERAGAVSRDGRLVVADPTRFREETLDGLVWTAVFGGRDSREPARTRNPGGGGLARHRSGFDPSALRGAGPG